MSFTKLSEIVSQDAFYHVLLFLTPKELSSLQLVSKHFQQLSTLDILWFEVSEIFIKKLLNNFYKLKLTNNILPTFNKEINWKNYHKSLYNVCFSTGYNGGPTSWGLEQNPSEPDFGQLGLGYDHQELNQISAFTLIPTSIDKDIIQIQSGGYHNLILSREGFVYSFGSNAFGQLGLGDRKSRSFPTRLNLEKIKSIHYGYAFSYAINESGECFGWGFNKNGRAGHSDEDSKWILNEGKNKYPYVDKPMKLKQFEGIKVKNIACGSGHTIFQTEDGKIYGIGRNDLRQLGKRRNFDERNFNGFTLNLPHKSEEYMLHEIRFDMCEIVNIACNSYSTAYVDSEKNLYLSGSTPFGIVDSPMIIGNLTNLPTYFHGTSSKYFWMNKSSLCELQPGESKFLGIELIFGTGTGNVVYGIDKEGNLISKGKSKDGLLGRNELMEFEKNDPIDFGGLKIKFEMVACGTQHW